MAKTEKKKSLRQKMRLKAELRLNYMIELMNTAAQRAVEESDTNIDPVDLMSLCCKTQTGTLRDKLVTQLTDEIQNELLGLWNKQDELDLGVNNAKS